MSHEHHHKHHDHQHHCLHVALKVAKLVLLGAATSAALCTAKSAYKVRKHIESHHRI